MTTNSYTGTVANPNGYKSFWDIYNREYREMWYHYENTTAYPSTPATRLVFEVTPYIGLAYSDNDVFDSTFFDESTNIGEGPFIGLPTQFPNMYPTPTFNEIGNFVPAKPITLSGFAAPIWDNTVLRVFSTDHCPVIGANINSAYNPNFIYFDISSPPAPYQTSTAMEQDFLSKYGKVFFYYWVAKDPGTSLVIADGYITAYCDTGDTTYWADTTIPASNLPGVGSAKLYKNIRCNDNGFRSYELVLEDGTYPSETVFANPLNGVSYRVSIETFRGGYSYGGGPSSGIGGTAMGGTASTVKLELN
ncbi:hypothetical protein [Paenimyroides viscosum]|uniref:Uncharacterized protein n=1 Tax=Paenimyroides viscosum TaxID=2488729 RepID=A0A3P1B0L6_9FLAO|nr:hypothetical protein [Paenimyroides viscosum]RRA94540.1 hypothetical protein EG242_09010 [Paenimyroides viscosum]